MFNHEKIAQQKAVADEVLNRLFSIDPHSIVAGGAPRDWYMGYPASDIDVFFYTTVSLDLVDELLRHVGIVEYQVKTGHNIPEWYKLNPELRVVYEFDLRGERVQLMLMKSSTFSSVVPKFPVSISKIWYKDKTIHPTNEFKLGRATNSIIQTGELYGDTHAYIQKIKAKFPSFAYYVRQKPVDKALW